MKIDKSLSLSLILSHWVMMEFTSDPSIAELEKWGRSLS